MTLQHPRYALMFALLPLLAITAGCVPSETLGTGVPAASADKFYFHMEREANARGYDTWRDAEQQTLSVEVDRGDLDYTLQLDEIVVTITPEADDSMSEGEVQTRIEALRQVHERLMQGASERARRVNAFD